MMKRRQYPLVICERESNQTDRETFGDLHAAFSATIARYVIVAVDIPVL